MKKIQSKFNINRIRFCNDIIYYSDETSIFQNNKLIANFDIINWITVFNNQLLINTIKYDKLYILNDKMNFLEGFYALESSILNKKYIVIPKKENNQYYYLIFNKHFEILNEIIWPLRMIFNENFLMYRKKDINIYSKYSTNLWQTDISNIGEYIKMDGSKAPANEIDGELFGSEALGLLYAPLAGGQLVALHADTGEIAWVSSTSYNGRYNIFNNTIYKVSDSLYVIDAITGNILEQKDYSEITDKEFIASGPVWAYEDVLILLDVRGANIVLLNRSTLEIEEFIHIENTSGIPHSKDVIIWHDNKLYVLDMENTLHIFEKE